MDIVKNRLFLLGAILSIVAAVRGASDEDYSKADWQNPQVLGINKLPPRNTAWPCPDASSGWKSNYDTSPWLVSLDGHWSLHWSPDPKSRPEKFYEPGFDASKWDKITVPSTWELEGERKHPTGQPNYGASPGTSSPFPHLLHRLLKRSQARWI